MIYNTNKKTEKNFHQCRQWKWQIRIKSEPVKDIEKEQYYLTQMKTLSRRKFDRVKVIRQAADFYKCF